MKKANPEYKQVQSQALQNVLRRDYTSFTIAQAEAERNFGKKGYIYICKIGYVKLNQHRNFQPIEVKTINVKFHKNKWYVNLSMEVDGANLIAKFDNCVGIDMGIKDIVITSNGEVYKNPKWLQKSEKEIIKLQRKLSKKKKGSKNRLKAKKKHQNLHEKITNQRRDYLHKVSYNIVQDNDLICIEELQTSNMMKNHKLAKSIANVSWNRLSLYLEYKTELYGKVFVTVDPKNTSQKCSSCGKIVKKDLSERRHVCPYCSLVLDRDYNAAINILKKGLKLAG